MSENANRMYYVGKIIFALFFCLIISAGIYFCSMIFIYGAWHCPRGNCQTPVWVDLTVFLLLANPIFIFAAGAYFIRKTFYSMTESKIYRVLLISSFALFPVFVFSGLIFYLVISSK